MNQTIAVERGDPGRARGARPRAGRGRAPYGL